MAHMFIFGLGYSAKAILAALQGGWTVEATGRDGTVDFAAALQGGWTVEATGRDGTVDFADGDAVRAALERADHVLSSVPPHEGADPVLAAYGDALGHRWLGYLSSTGVYGDTGGAWVDESAPTGGGLRSARAEADAEWLRRGARVFRLPGIYGPGRSALDRVREGKAHRIAMPGQVFSRVHVEDIAAGIVAALDAPAGAYNLADDLPASGNAVTEEACRLLGVPPPPLQTMDEAGLSPMARGFYAENRRVANGKAKRVLGWTPRHPTYREGLAAILTAERE